jgi:Uri superfamily endonuclease
MRKAQSELNSIAPGSYVYCGSSVRWGHEDKIGLGRTHERVALIKHMHYNYLELKYKGEN